jgi:putative flippase GtrA
MSRRVLQFVGVGALGFVVQMATLTALATFAHWPHALATAAAVEAAVLFNFFSHERWTWADRRGGSRLLRLWQFHAANGLTSVAGNVILTSALERAGVPGIQLANAIAVVTLSVVNFALADRWVFTSRVPIACVAVLVFAGRADAAGPSAATLRAWDQHVREVESSLAAHANDPSVSEPEGRTIGVPDGTIHVWRGSTIARNTTVAAVVEALTNPGTPPPQPDVVESRVLARQGRSLRVYLKLVRTAVITVTYDTEHQVDFTIHGRDFATSRSIATRIAEVGGDDRGFLWRLNSYWRYRQVGNDVQIDVLSLSLSRDVPMLLKPVASPIVGHIARESMVHTLDAVRNFFD